MKRMILAAAIFGLLTTDAHAELAVGDKPQLAFKALDGRPVDLKQMHGNLVVLDFWAVSDLGKSVESRLVGLKKQHADDGVMFVGICCDRDLGRATTFIKDVGMDWPQYFDGLTWNSRPCQELGLHHYETLLLDDAGTVLWMGGASQIDRQLTNALIQHPPSRIDPDVLKSANALLDATEASLSSGDNLAALKTFATVPLDAKKNKDFATRFSAIEARVKDAQAAALAHADSLYQQKQFIDCEAELTKLNVALQNMPAAKEVLKRLSDLRDNSEAKAQFDKARRDKEADAALAVIRKYRDDGDDEQAYPRAKALVQDFPDSPAASEANLIITTYEKDAKFVQRMKQAAIDAKAKPIFSLAENYRAAGRKDQAREKFQAVINLFPDTDWAERAKRELAEMDQ